MELTPQALHDVEFREARRGGYNTRDVDDFLERVAVGIGQLQDRLREAYHRAEAAEGRLADMQRQLDDVQRRGLPQQHDVPATATAHANAGSGDADETLRRTLVLAQRTADATIKEAKDEAARLVGDARDEASRLRAEAETEAMRDAQAEVDHLLEAREALLHDVEVLERHVDDQRNRVRGGVEELQRLLDDPNAFRTAAAPQVTEIDRRPPPRPPVDARPELPAREGREGRDHDRDLHEPRPVPVLDPSSNGGGFVPKGGQVTIPAPPLDPPAPVGPPPSANGLDHLDHLDSERVPPADAGSLNDGAMVAALQELHGSSPSRDPLPSRGEPPLDPSSPEPFEPLPSLPSRGESPLEPSAPEPFGALPGLPSRGESPREPSVSEPFGALPSLPSRGESPPLAHESFEIGPLGPSPAPPPPPAAPAHEPFESLPSLPQRGDAGPGAGPAPSPEPFESLPSLPQRGDAGPGREPLPSRDGGAGREPLLARNSGPGQPEPLNFPAPTPGTTGFLPDLNAAFNPPPPPPEDLAPPMPPAPAGGPVQVDDLGPIDAPPPPPPPPGFEHLHEVGGIPIEPGSRPSEWGRGVFDSEDELDAQANARFGRRP